MYRLHALPCTSAREEAARSLGEAERPHPPKRRCPFCAYSAACIVAIVLFVQVFKVVICLRCLYMVFNSRAFVSWLVSSLDRRFPMTQDVAHLFSCILFFTECSNHAYLYFWELLQAVMVQLVNSNATGAGQVLQAAWFLFAFIFVRLLWDLAVKG